MSWSLTMGINMKINVPTSSNIYRQSTIQQQIQSTVTKANQTSPNMTILNAQFYQLLTSSPLQTAKDALNLLRQFDVKNEGNQTVKEKRQLALLVYARQQSELEHNENKEVINQALLSYLSYQGVYHQFALGMIDNQEEYAEFFKPDSASFSF